MTSAPNTAPYVLPYQDPSEFPNARNLVGSNGLAVLDSGPGQTLTITSYGNLLALNNFQSTGFVYYNAGTFSSQTFGNSETTTISNTGGVLNVNVTPQSSVQLTNFLVNMSPVGTGSSLSITAGNGLTLSTSFTGEVAQYNLAVTSPFPSGASFVLSASSAGVPQGQSLGNLTTGLLKNTVSGDIGTLSTAVPGTDYMLPNANLDALGSILPVQGRLLVGNGSSWVGRDVGLNGYVLQSNGTDCLWGPVSQTAAPIDGPYLTFTSNSALENSQNLGLLSSGLLKNNASNQSASLTTAIAGVDYQAPLTSSNPLSVNAGGTGATIKSSAFNALSPMSAVGDLIYGGIGGAGNRLPIGSNGQVLTVLSGLPVWTIPSGMIPFSVLDSATSSVTVATQQGYVPMNTSSAVGFFIPASMASGSVFRIAGYGAGGWAITLQAGQSLAFGNQTSSVGLASTLPTDCVEVVCVVANTTFLVISSVGNLSIL